MRLQTNIVKFFTRRHEVIFFKRCLKSWEDLWSVGDFLMGRKHCCHENIFFGLRTSGIWNGLIQARVFFSWFGISGNPCMCLNGTYLAP